MVNATFGTVEYRDGGVIAAPVTFAENVIAPSKSIFEITHVSGDALTDMEYRLIGQNTAFKLIFEVPPDRKGSFKIAANGDVFKVSSGTWENVVITPTTVNYGTLVPRIVDYKIPANYTLGAPLHVLVEYNIPVTGWNLNNVYEVFLFEGAKLGKGTPYKWTGASPPDIYAPIAAPTPADLDGTDWTILTQPDPNLPKTAENGFDGNIWHGEEGQYFLIRFDNPQEVGIFNMTPREGRVRGPIA